MKRYLIALIALVILSRSIAAAPLSEAQAIEKVKAIPEFSVYSSKHKYTFDDNELIEDPKQVSLPLHVPIWRIDVRTIVHDSIADHLSLWNRFMVDATDGSIFVWDRESDLKRFVTLKDWQAAQERQIQTEQGAAANP